MTLRLPGAADKKHRYAPGQGEKKKKKKEREGILGKGKVEKKR